jgi:hypothetical protein
VKSFGNQYEGMIAGQLLKEFEQDVFADDVNGVNRVALFVALNVGEFVEPLPFRGRNDRITNSIVQLPDGQY